MDEMVWLDLSGGEPFLRKDIDRICHLFVDRNNVKSYQHPDQCHPDERHRELGQCDPRQPAPFRVNVAISLDGIGETHDKAVASPAIIKRPSRQ